ncbi:hypothetical protein DYD21_12570 [Rhodohalobacter sp. SW132]|uniref:MauE/DoxX family redox-associated membrane protein n=1 Tax=Rhodohalobacter sp. SW132 TaxID=2293433 RepID=UPI000E273CB9|nr:MauE/DoxX family redox-associated membrane protein [Rhodohalobacter sp. SW132]REL33085.1 hypothetical protein DYD21_12570 [Rhodohalobacter sp. SW132]
MYKKKIISIVQISFRVILGALLLIAGVFKLQDNSALFETIAYISWLPTGLKSFVIDLLPYVEVLVGALMITGIFRKTVIPVGAMIYLGFFAFAVYGLGSGMEGDCGCFGEPDDSNILAMLLGSTFGWSMVIRNGIFLAMAGILFYNPERKFR